MRRARIKAMATLPARRKATRDAVEESTDSVNPVPNEVVDSKSAIETTTSCTENVDEPVIEIAKLQTSTKEEGAKLQTSMKEESAKLQTSTKEEGAKLQSSMKEEGAKSQEPLSIQQGAESPVPGTNPNESLEDVPEILEDTIGETTDQPRIISGQENCQSSPLNETRVSSQDNASVTKVSQTRTSFMRPTPRLDGGGRMRRNSIQGSGASASESEDDCRRTSSGIPSRMRNDSVSSVHSPKGVSQSCATAGSANAMETNVSGSGGGCTSIAKNSSTVGVRQKRKIVVSESARKLAEARREFQLKYEHKQPDRAKLIMYDLIHYNPVTNPMKKSDGSTPANQRSSSSIARPETEDEEDEDGDAGGEAMPVPQVKVGPDGSLMIDEQSLVIEHTGAKKSRQALARTEALVDEENNGSGFYKKRPKCKDWPKWETLKFYRALNTVGTDFLLMQSLFPTRTRQELKKKYKKEEKLNQRLVEKALTYHQEFDIDSLKEDLATFEETEKKRSESAKMEKKPSLRQSGRPKRKKSKSRRMAAASISEINDNTEDLEDSFEPENRDGELPTEVREPVPRTEQKKTSQRRPATNGGWTRTESTSSSDDSASDTEIYQVKPTRSGRKPKVRKLQAPTINTLDNLFSDPEQEIEESPSLADPSAELEEERVTTEACEDQEMADAETIGIGDTQLVGKSQSVHSLAGISQVEPGSLVIVSRESAEDPGETVLQVYMVSSDIDEGSGNGLQRNMTPVILTPELLNTVTAGITKVSPIDVNTEQ